jgi:polyphenol oxidase
MPSSSLFHIPQIFQAFASVVAVQSTRRGGYSTGDFASMNLGLSSGDEREVVLKNRAAFFSELGVAPEQVVLSSQVHDDKILLAESGGIYSGYDAEITNQKNLFLAVSIADCTPILVYDAAHQAVAAVHSGWRGTEKHILRKTLEQMSAAFGTRGSDVFAFIGACISGERYEVGEDVASHFSDAYKQPQPNNKFLLDLKAANRDMLLTFGVPPAQIEVSPFCTHKHHRDFFSHRQSGGKTGRMLAVIGMRES